MPCNSLCWIDLERRNLAEREGFEPPVPFRVRRFSRPEPSTTRPPLQPVHESAESNHLQSEKPTPRGCRVDEIVDGKLKRAQTFPRDVPCAKQSPSSALPE